MRKLVTWNLMTLDGYFEGPAPWDLAFHDTAWGEQLEAFSIEQFEEIGTLLFGRRTYDGMASHWSKATGAIADFMNGVDKVVATRTLDHADWSHSRILDGAVPEAVTRLKEEPGKDVYVFGSADLTADLSRHGLVDEYRFCIAPVVLGMGHPFFKPGADRLALDLLEARPLRNGAIILRYSANR